MPSAIQGLQGASREIKGRRAVEVLQSHVAHRVAQRNRDAVVELKDSRAYIDMDIYGK